MVMHQVVGLNDYHFLRGHCGYGFLLLMRISLHLDHSWGMVNAVSCTKLPVRAQRWDLVVRVAKSQLRKLEMRADLVFGGMWLHSLS